MSLKATYIGANGWLLEFAPSGGPIQGEPDGQTRALRLLVDPWLQGPLVFAPGPWLLRGERSDALLPPEDLDLLLLTQGVSDHCHLPSLSLLPRGLPVVASPAAAARVRRLGFEQVTELHPGESRTLAALTITATAGAAVPHRENGYLLDHPGGSLYLEPHGFLPDDLPPRPLDAVITPVIDLGLPPAITVVHGRRVLPQLLQRFQSRTVLASSTGGQVDYAGLLAGLLRFEGSMAEAARLVERHAPSPCRLIDPVPGTPYALPVG
jgi:Beta-lactamase superfamily domain